MDTAPAAPTDAPDRARPGGRTTIGFPSIPSRSDEDPPPVPVPSIPLPSDPAEAPGEPAPTPPHLTPVRSRPDRRSTAEVPPGTVGPVEAGETFSPAVRAKLKHYVYLFVDPRTGRPFHAGLGRDDRCFEHLRAARRDRLPTSSRTPEPPALDRIRQIESAGRPVRIEMLRYGMDRDEALVVEAAAHDLLGLPGSPAGDSQRRPVDEVRLLLTKRAKFKRPHQVVLLRVGPPGADSSYESARHGWRLGRRWLDVGGLRSPHWAVVVVGETVHSVYRLDRWEPSPPGKASGPPATVGQSTDRYSFVGRRDLELERRYVGRSVAPYMGKGSQGAVAYVWCGPHWVNTAP